MTIYCVIVAVLGNKIVSEENFDYHIYCMRTQKNVISVIKCYFIQQYVLVEVVT